jgi:hypothetical protein
MARLGFPMNATRLFVPAWRWFSACVSQSDMRKGQCFPLNASTTNELPPTLSEGRMAIDFTVILANRQRFGDKQADIPERPVEQDATFVGPSKDFPFSCPNVLSGKEAVLHFQSLGVTAVKDFGFGPMNILRINGVDIPGGITRGPDVGNFPLWTTHTLLVPANVLKDENVLHIESVKIPLAHEATLDNFIIDNVVVFFKTGLSPDLTPPVGGGVIGKP